VLRRQRVPYKALPDLQAAMRVAYNTMNSNSLKRPWTTDESNLIVGTALRRTTSRAHVKIPWISQSMSGEAVRRNENVEWKVL
jgi:hypothetical protein